MNAHFHTHTLAKTKRFHYILLVLTFTLFYSLLIADTSLAQTVKLPITLDHPLLTELLKKSYFKASHQTAQLSAPNNDCTQVVLSHPILGKREEHLKLSAQILLRLGAPLGNECIMPLEWEGFIDIIQRPQIDPTTWRLSLETVDVIVSTPDHKPLKGTDHLWDQIAPEIQKFIGEFSIDLAPPVADLKSFLLPLFPENTRKETEVMLNSLRPGNITIHDEGITIKVLAEVQARTRTDSAEMALSLTDEELEKLIGLWEMWDSFFIHLITTLSSQMLTEEEKGILIDLLLETRHTFMEEVQQHTIGRDFVREQFVNAWKQLSPIFKAHFIRNPKDNALSYLSFITAADALNALDDLGPTLGIEISRDGLLRLVKMLDTDTAILQYSPNVNTTLQELFNSNAPPSHPQDTLPPSTSPEKKRQSMLKSWSPLAQLHNYFFSSAYAASPTFAEIKKWQTPKKGIGEYLVKVRNVLDTASISLLTRENIPQDIHTLYRTLIPAIAWQESCFRQFVVKNRKLTYLVSYNNSSVGIMQVNERVWRGIYDRNRLRWDIRYNAFAGCEIANLYMRKYVLRKSSPELLQDKELVANIVYAMYNGGPGQYTKYLERNKKREYYQSDKLFSQKYGWVSTGKWEKINVCL